MAHIYIGTVYATHPCTALYAKFLVVATYGTFYTSSYTKFSQGMHTSALLHMPVVNFSELSKYSRTLVCKPTNLSKFADW